MAEVAATAEPEIAPNIMQETTLTNANPPGNAPINAMAHSMRRLAIPPRPIIKPDNTKKGMAKRAKLFNPPTIRWAMVMVAGVISIFISMASNVATPMLMEIGTFNSNKAKNTTTKIMPVNSIIAYSFEVETTGWQC
uniref:Uncharacterized protein n=1 Tax=uncultured marine thaumarchaeote AD1000_14_F02 TaxID=1455892 RepID=A0A075FJY7_9ARCH|nr:hypothetical protein [uncultured marine thaumarchaeote AD1000_14_F02]